jgi:hypothetical protein
MTKTRKRESVKVKEQMNIDFAKITFCAIALLCPMRLFAQSAETSDKHLLLDSRVIDRTENVRLAVGVVKKHPANPLWGEDKPWEVRFDNVYANVIYDADEKLYKCWYNPFIVDGISSATAHAERSKSRYRPKKDRETGVCYATSKDGIKWEKPELGLIDFNGSKANNLILRDTHGPGIFKDDHEADPAKR